MDGNAPYLLTPGPLTTAAATKQAMLRDWGSRDKDFIALTAEVRERLVSIAGVADSHTAVPVQGSGTFAIEATLGTLAPRDGKVLVLVNGAYGRRMLTILERLGRASAGVETAEDTPIDPAAVDNALAQDPAITHVAAVQCETTSGILNPMGEIAAVVAGRGRRLIIDAMSAFGALPTETTDYDALVASSNKCLEGVPGLGFAIVRREALEVSVGNAPSLSLDLHDQWRGFEANGQWRFTPPTHVAAAFQAALRDHAAEGSVEGRGARYRENCRILIDGMRAMGFEPLLAADVQAPIIVTFHMPADPRFDFERFYDRLAARGFVIYPGKLTVAESFRMGCIGHLGSDEMQAAIDAARAVLGEMGVESGAPA
ncbi:MAG: 2-aminoethylphosphonate--pyruvate transaminase [Minwuiales bacterium]|nr:2-aminoethylphosphonate--pyruvate transaminase [Minwuiales bacterium]